MGDRGVTGRRPDRSLDGRPDRGSGSLLVVAAVAVVVLLAAAALIAAGYLVDYRVARTGADAAALSGAMSVTGSGSAAACRAAVGVAARHGATVRSCRLTGAPPAFVLTVEVERSVRPVWPGLPAHVRVVAHAGSAELAGS